MFIALCRPARDEKHARRWSQWRATATSSVHATAITSGNASQITKCGWSTRT